MTPSGDELPAQEITILLVEDDPPTLRLQDASAKAGFDVAGGRDAGGGARASPSASQKCC
jgi:hypothetical protein